MATDRDGILRLTKNGLHLGGRSLIPDFLLQRKADPLTTIICIPVQLVTPMHSKSRASEAINNLKITLQFLGIKIGCAWLADRQDIIKETMADVRDLQRRLLVIRKTSRTISTLQERQWLPMPPKVKSSTAIAYVLCARFLPTSGRPIYLEAEIRIPRYLSEVAFSSSGENWRTVAVHQWSREDDKVAEDDRLDVFELVMSEKLQPFPDLLVADGVLTSEERREVSSKMESCMPSGRVLNAIVEP